MTRRTPKATKNTLQKYIGDGTEMKPDGQQKQKIKKKRIALWIILGILALALIAGGIYVWYVLKRPDVFFEDTVQQIATAAPEATPIFDLTSYLPTEAPDTTPVPTPIDAAAIEEPTAQASETPQEQPVAGIVNVALFGIDAYEDGSSTSGSMPHTDANLIVAINFDTKKVSLISIARDCLTVAPDRNGFYKFNGIFNVGGGIADPKAGLALSCRAAEQWLGGVSVPYYYGVDFQAVVDLVDMIGGIDYDLDITIHTFDDRTIGKGRHHLDGLGVLAYLRMRVTAGGRDTDRTARQRKMLVAIFKKLKKEGKLSMVPDILKTMGNNVYTNTTLTQTAALVSFAQGVDADAIETYSIQGVMGMPYDWAFCYIDQQKRIEILKTVYGIDAKPLGFNSKAYEKFLHENGFKALQYLGITKRIFAAVHKTSADAMTDAQKTAYASCWKDYSDLRAMYDLADAWAQAHYDGKATADETKQFQSYCSALESLESRLKDSANALNAAFGSSVKATWGRSIASWYEKGSDINEIYVDFR